MEMAVSSVVLAVIVLPNTVDLLNYDAEAELSSLGESLFRLHRLGGTTRMLIPHHLIIEHLVLESSPQ